MNYKYLFLDLDGTILNTLEDIAAAVNYSLKKHNRPTKSVETIKTYLGYGSKYLISRALDNFDDKELIDVVFNDYKQYYLENFAVFTKPYPGTYDVLKEFKDKGGKIALISNKPQDLSIKLLAKFFPNLFDVIYGQSSSTIAKPDPMTCHLAMRDLNIDDKKDILYLGDSLIDLETAKNAGLDVILCNYGFAGEGDVIKSGNTYINDIREVRGYLYNEKQ